MTDTTIRTPFDNDEYEAGFAVRRANGKRNVHSSISWLAGWDDADYVIEQRKKSGEPTMDISSPRNTDRPVRTHDDMTKIIVAISTLPILGWWIAHPKNPTHQAIFLVLSCLCIGFIVHKFRSTSAPPPLLPDTPEARKQRAKQRSFFDALMGRQRH